MFEAKASRIGTAKTIRHASYGETFYCIIPYLSLLSPNKGKAVSRPTGGEMISVTRDSPFLFSELPAVDQNSCHRFEVQDVEACSGSYHVL